MSEAVSGLAPVTFTKPHLSLFSDPDPLLELLAVHAGAVGDVEVECISRAAGPGELLPRAEASQVYGLQAVQDKYIMSASMPRKSQIGLLVSNRENEVDIDSKLLVVFWTC